MLFQYLASLMLREGEAGECESRLLDRSALVLPECSLEAVTKMVHFLYSGELVSDQTGLAELSSLATSLQLPHLASQISVLQARLRHSGVEDAEPKDAGYAEVQMERDGSPENLDAVETVENGLETCDEINNASFITLGGLENLGTEEMIVETSVITVNEKNDIDLETPVQSPASEAGQDGGEAILVQDQAGHVTSIDGGLNSLATIDPSAISADGQGERGGGDCGGQEGGQNYLQCELCSIACTDTEYLRRHKSAKHGINIYVDFQGSRY